MATPTVTHAIFDYSEWFKAYGWGFISFPVVMYIVKTFGKQIWADLSALISKLTAKAQASITPASNG